MSVPTFYLYGEPHRAIEDGFAHVESIEHRSRPSGWTIQPHAHRALTHIFFLAAGGGGMRVAGETLPCPAPCLLLVPAGVAHGFTWEVETAGAVITLATARLAGLGWFAPETAGLLDRPAAIPLPSTEAEKVAAHVADLRLELGWAKAGHEAAVQAALLAILVIALRGHAPAAAPGGGRQRALVAALRARIEERFRLREPVAAYAAALGTSETALRAACAVVAGSAPAALLDQRTIVEARRALLFTDVAVGALAYALGFEDLAYFSRFFRRHVGRSPRQYRASGPRDHEAGLSPRSSSIGPISGSLP